MIIQTSESNVEKETEKEFDAHNIANAFFNAYKTASSKLIEEKAKALRKELTYQEYMEVLSEISQMDTNSYAVHLMVNTMKYI